MDPTDIVLVPFDLARLTVYVAVVSALSWLRVVTVIRPAPLLMPLLVQRVSATAVIWIMAIVAGASPTKDLYHTGLASLYLATLTVVVTTSPGTPPPQQSNYGFWQSRLALPALNSEDYPSINTNTHFSNQLLAACQIHATLFVTVPFQVLRLYDWGSQIQRWPLPMILGSTYGFVVGTLVGLGSIVALQCSVPALEFYSSWVTQSVLSNTHPKRRD